MGLECHHLTRLKLEELDGGLGERQWVCAGDGNKAGSLAWIIALDSSGESATVAQKEGTRTPLTSTSVRTVKMYPFTRETPPADAT